MKRNKKHLFKDFYEIYAEVKADYAETPRTVSLLLSFQKKNLVFLSDRNEFLFILKVVKCVLYTTSVFFSSLKGQSNEILDPHFFT